MDEMKMDEFRLLTGVADEKRSVRAHPRKNETKSKLEVQVNCSHPLDLRVEDTPSFCHLKPYFVLLRLLFFLCCSNDSRVSVPIQDPDQISPK